MSRISSGFTLIELLIVLSLQIMLITLAMFSVQQLSMNWRKESAKVGVSLGEYKAIDTVSSALNATTQYMTLDPEGRSGFYFLGRQNGFTAVTLSGVLNVGRVSVYRLLKERQSDGLFSLYYEEAPLTGYVLLEANQKHNFNFRFRVAADLKELTFRYRGWDSFESYLAYQNELATERSIVWHMAFDGMKMRLNPDVVEISLEGHSWYVKPLDREDFVKVRRPKSDEL